METGFDMETDPLLAPDASLEFFILIIASKRTFGTSWFLQFVATRRVIKVFKYEVE